MTDDPTIPIGDIRRTNPGSDRQGAFKRGWTAAVKDLKGGDESSKYSEGPPPKELTWHGDGRSFALAARAALLQAIRNEIMDLFKDYGEEINSPYDALDLLL